MAWGTGLRRVHVRRVVADAGPGFLQAAPLATMIATERPTLAGAVPTIWTDLLAYLDANPTDVSSMGEVIVGRFRPARRHSCTRSRSATGIEIIHAWGMTEMSSARFGVPPARRVCPVRRPWAYRYTQGRVPAGVEARIIGPDGTVMPSDGKSVGETRGSVGPWGDPAVPR